MRKFLTISALTVAMAAGAQTNENYTKNTYYVGVGTNTVSGAGFTHVEGSKATVWNLGLEGGYFVADNTAVVAGLGYQHFNKNYDALNYLVGAKYYAGGIVPLQVDYNGNNKKSDNLGLQFGYALTVNPQLNLEPNLRYNINLRTGGSNVFSGGMQVNYFFR